MPKIEVDEDVLAYLEQHARPFVDTNPNAVLRRVLLQGKPEGLPQRSPRGSDLSTRHAVDTDVFVRRVLVEHFGGKFRRVDRYSYMFESHRKRAYFLPAEEIVRRAEQQGWSGKDVEVNIAPADHWWRELDWDLRELKQNLPATRSFTLTLQPTYYREGFFNVVSEYEYLFGADGEDIQVCVGDEPNPFSGRIDRRANENGTPRIRVGAVLRDWFSTYASEGDDAKVVVESPTAIRLVTPGEGVK